MGRYYNGDIAGKFWFPVQPSGAADRFGVKGYQPESLYYYFDNDNLKDVEEEIENIKTNILGDHYDKVEAFFKDRQYYNDKEFSEHLNLTEEQVKPILRAWADLELGIKIRDCIVETGSCSFEAEC